MGSRRPHGLEHMIEPIWPRLQAGSTRPEIDCVRPILAPLHSPDGTTWSEPGINGVIVHTSNNDKPGTKTSKRQSSDGRSVGEEPPSRRRHSTRVSPITDPMSCSSSPKSRTPVPSPSTTTEQPEVTEPTKTRRSSKPARRSKGPKTEKQLEQDRRHAEQEQKRRLLIREIVDGLLDFLNTNTDRVLEKCNKDFVPVLPTLERSLEILKQWFRDIQALKEEVRRLTRENQLKDEEIKYLNDEIKYHRGPRHTGPMPSPPSSAQPSPRSGSHSRSGSGSTAAYGGRSYR